MASVSAAKFAEIEQQFPTWAQKFPASERDAMLSEDLFAGKSVASVLISIVVFGLVTMISTVLFCL